MNIALILAGGTGSRMGQNIPKQFIAVDNIPIIVHTLLKFEHHPEIDAIQIVCVEGWENEVASYAKKYNITKIHGVVRAGATRYHSIRRGMESLDSVSDDDVIIVHDSVRPLASDESISDVIAICKQYGNSMSVLDCVDSMYERTDTMYTSKEVARSKLVRGQTPEAVSVKRMREMYGASDEKNICIDSISALQIALGWDIYIAKGSERNIKLTTPEDIDLFKALLNIERET